MLTKDEYVSLSAKEDKTDDELEAIKAYEDEHGNSDDTNSHKDGNSADNNSPAPANTIDDLHEQNPKELEEKLISKEKSAEYQKAQKAKREAEDPEEQKSGFGGAFILLSIIAAFLGWIWYTVQKHDKEAAKTGIKPKKTTLTENRTENSNRKTEQGAETLTGVFNG